MRLTNLHTHTVYCDGKCKTEEMIQAAVKCNFQSVGISSHGPVPFVTDWNMQADNVEKYVEEVTSLKEKYRGVIDVFFGMELDYIPGTGFDSFSQSLISRLDYYIGSVHYLGKFTDGSMWTVDYSTEELVKGINENFQGNTRSAVETYYGLISEMASRYHPPVIGHIDLIKKNNKNNLLFNEDESWYRDAAEKCLDTIKAAGSVVEINTGGMARGYTSEQYPSSFIVELSMEKNIPVTINSDAHTAEAIDCKLSEMYELIRSMGFERVSCLTGCGWATRNLNLL